jgi:hypothetical protein
MESSRALLTTLRYTLGLTNLRDVTQLSKVSQSRLEQKFDAISERFSTKRMGSIYMRWLIHQDFTIGERLQSQVVQQWVSFVDSWGLKVEEAIILWAKTMKEPTESGQETKQLRENRNALRHEIESQFFKLKYDARLASGMNIILTDIGTQNPYHAPAQIKPCLHGAITA